MVDLISALSLADVRMTSRTSGGPGPTAILLVKAPDARGLVAGISDFVYRHEGNIVDADQHTDTSAGRFLMRIEWQIEGFRLGRDEIATAFGEWAQPRDAAFTLHFSDERPRVAVFVSKLDHCLHDLVLRQRSGELAAELALVVSNHPDLEPVARSYGIPFHAFDVTPGTKASAEAKQVELLRREGVSTLVLARYMQVLGPTLLDAFPDEVINIHHSFLPAFPGARPYQQAYRRGVKVIGATSHYATPELDEGPIIEQDVARVTHRDDVAAMVRKGRDLERLVLGRAVRLHLERRVLVDGGRTVVFE
jgi:formyltetrahydrofolate deformylase